MISKITKGSDFKGLMGYLFSKPGAEFLGGSVIGETADEIARELIESSLPNNRVQKPVGHFSLSIPPTDKLDELDWLDIAAYYMKEMGYDCNKYAVVHHTDREHDHIHIAACRVREDTGKCVKDSWDKIKSEAVDRKLEVEYNLTPTPSSQDKDRRSPTTGERRLLARTGEDSVRVKLQDTIDELTADHPTMPELIDHLKDQGINVQVKETKTGSMGISYELDEIAFSGTHLGKAYTFNGLQKHRGVEYNPEHDSALAKRTFGIATASSRPPVMTSQNSSTTDSTDGDDDNETIGAIAPNELQSNDATAPQDASSLTSQTANSDLSDKTVPSDKTVQSETDLTVPTDPTKPNHDDDQTDDEESINVDPVEENWEPLRSHLIEQYCLPPSIIDVLHETERLYANVDGMAVFSLRTLDNIETGVWVLNPSTEDDKWVDLNLEPDVEEEVNGEPAFFWISSLGDAPNDKAIITQDPIETISYVALDPSFEQNNTIYISAFDVDSLPIKSLQQLKSNVVVSFKCDSEGIELRNELAIALPKSQKEELDEAGWNGVLKEQSQEQEQMQLIAQYQSQQESQMEL